MWQYGHLFLGFHGGLIGNCTSKVTFLLSKSFLSRPQIKHVFFLISSVLCFSDLDTPNNCLRLDHRSSSTLARVISYFCEIQQSNWISIIARLMWPSFSAINYMGAIIDITVRITWDLQRCRWWLQIWGWGRWWWQWRRRGCRRGPWPWRGGLCWKADVKRHQSPLHSSNPAINTMQKNCS